MPHTANRLPWATGAYLLLAACGTSPTGGDAAPQTEVPKVACPSPAPSYKTAVASLVATHCGQCHTPGAQAYSGINLSTQAALATERHSADQQVATGLMPREADDEFEAGPKLLLRQYLACDAPDN